MWHLLMIVHPLAVEHPPAHSSSAQGVAAVLGASLLFLLAVAMPVAQTLCSSMTRPQLVTSSAVAQHTDGPTLAPSSIMATPQFHKESSEEVLKESEERLLRAMGYSESEVAQDADGLTEAEIAAFRLRTGVTVDGDSPHVRFKDRAQPLREVVTRWQQEQADGNAHNRQLGEGSPKAQGSLQQPHAAARAANKQSKVVHGTARRGGTPGKETACVRKAKAKSMRHAGGRLAACP